MTRARDTTNPGSCPPTYSYNPSLPGKVTADPSKPSGYDVEIGYSTPAGVIQFTSCTNNVVGCKVFATCVPGDTDQITLTISGNNISGTLQRTASGDAACSDGGTINFNVSGTRQ